MEKDTQNELAELAKTWTPTAGDIDAFAAWLKEQPTPCVRSFLLTGLGHGWRA